MKNFFRYWFPWLLCLGAIYYLSSIPDYRTQPSGFGETMSRKWAHLVEYAVLAYLTWRVAGYRGNRTSRTLAILSVVFCFVYAASDEWHQSFVPGRYAKVRDVFLDGLGAMMMTSVLYRKVIRVDVRSAP